MGLNTVLIEGSARHIHVSKEDLAVLFGQEHKLTNKKELSQPGQFACEERVRLVGPKGAIERVSILGPERTATQVELSFTDARILGINPPIRESGDVEGSAAVTVVGPAGEISLAQGAIVAKRHVHLRPVDAAEIGVADKDVVSVRVGGERAITFNEVVVRVNPAFQPRMHIDFDEMNAAGLSGETEGVIIVSGAH